MKRIISFSLRGIVVAAALLISWGCASLPANPQQVESFGLTDTAGTRLARTFQPKVAEHPEVSGLRPMLSGVDAFAARITLADLAEKSIDVQYYIWDPDNTGKLLAQHLVAAADRGVRVRALLDDFGSVANDQRLLALDSHPNIEVRLFNPIALRGHDALGMMLDFSRTTRRMHNKSFNVDNHVAVVGGRNVGDGYFDASDGLDMADFDVMAVGPVVSQVTTQFDLYWNSPASYPIASLSSHPTPPQALSQSRDLLNAHAAKMKETDYGKALARSPMVNEIQSGDAKFFWGRTTLMHDDPAKVASLSNNPEDRLLPKIHEIADKVHDQLLVVSPYFVPGDAGVKFFGTLRQRGVRVIILTNSLASTDALPAYAAYTKYREKLLALGVELYEFKPGSAYRPPPEKNNDPDAPSSLRGSSRASLHAKTFTFDQREIFIGSLNLDPRSAHLNTEVGVVMESPELAKEFSERFQARLSEIAWRVEAVPDNNLFFKGVHLNWIAQEKGSTVRLTSEPGQSFFKNFTVGLVKILPIESQL